MRWFRRRPREVVEEQARQRDEARRALREEAVRSAADLARREAERIETEAMQRIAPSVFPGDSVMFGGRRLTSEEFHQVLNERARQINDGLRRDHERRLHREMIEREHARWLAMGESAPVARLERRHVEDSVLMRDLLLNQQSEFRQGESLIRDPNMIFTGRGGYVVAWRRQDHLFVNVSHPSMGGTNADGHRRDFLALAEQHGIPVIPFAEPNIHRVDTNARVSLIERVGLESVFRIGEKFYISGYDTQEDPPMYFLAQLPSEPRSVDHGRDLLMPESVRKARAAGIEVKRQGDLFAIKTSLTNQKIREAGGKLFPDPVVQETVPFYGTRHTASRVAVMPEGVMLGGGVMKHLGEEHKDLTLGDGWWLISRNTVPAEPRRANATPTQNRPVRAPDRDWDRLRDMHRRVLWGMEPW